ncbi:MAG: BrnT family toxin [Burkholderiales bacterium]
MDFDWDPEKAAENAAKHGVTFEEAGSVFSDPLAITFPDPDHSVDEERVLTFGMSNQGRLLAVISTDQSDTLRIISARTTTRRERGIYEEG